MLLTCLQCLFASFAYFYYNIFLHILFIIVKNNLQSYYSNLGYYFIIFKIYCHYLNTYCYRSTSCYYLHRVFACFVHFYYNTFLSYELPPHVFKTALNFLIYVFFLEYFLANFPVFGIVFNTFLSVLQLSSCSCS